jgi:hypothetical protein
VDSLWQDFRYSLHALAKSPQFALIAILTLGIGIATNTIIFSVAGGIFVRGIPYPNANRLIHLSRGYPGGKAVENLVTPNFWTSHIRATRSMWSRLIRLLAHWV